MDSKILLFTLVVIVGSTIALLDPFNGVDETKKKIADIFSACEAEHSEEEKSNDVDNTIFFKCQERLLQHGLVTLDILFWNLMSRNKANYTYYGNVKDVALQKFYQAMPSEGATKFMEDVKKVVQFIKRYEKDGAKRQTDEFRFNLFGTAFVLEVFGNKETKIGEVYETKTSPLKVYKQVNFDIEDKENIANNKTAAMNKLELTMLKNLVDIVKNKAEYYYPKDDFQPLTREEMMIYRVMRKGLTSFEGFERLMDSMIMVKVAQKYSQYFILDRVIIPAVFIDPELIDKIDIVDIWAGINVGGCSTFESKYKSLKKSKTAMNKIHNLQAILRKIVDPNNFEFIDPTFWHEQKNVISCDSVEEFNDVLVNEAHVYQYENMYIDLDFFVKETMEILGLISKPRKMLDLIRWILQTSENFKIVYKDFEYWESKTEEQLSLYIANVAVEIEKKAEGLIKYE